MKKIKTIATGIVVLALLLSYGNNVSDNSNAKESNAEIKKDSIDIEFAFIADNKYIIISDNPDTNWIKGIPILSKTVINGAHSAIADVKLESLPPKYLDIFNKKFNIFSDNGSTFIAKINSLKLLTELFPHFEQVQKWNGVDYNDSKRQSPDDGSRYTDEQIALDIWKSTGQHYLVAEFVIENITKNTDNFYFALPSDKTASVFKSVSSKKMADVKSKINNIVNQTKDYATIQQEFMEKSENHNNNWWTDKESNESFVFFELNNKKGYSTLNHTSGNACGGDFYAKKFSIWKTDEDSLPILLYMADGAYNTILATDIDGDNIPEFLIDDGFGNRSLLKKVGKEWTEYYTWTIPYQDCGC